jgi:cytochrome c-type biogenesis protein CcmE
LKRKFIIGGFFVGLGVFFLGYVGFMGGVTYYYEVGELLDEEDTIAGQTVRVSGIVAPGVEKNGLEMQFVIVDNTGLDASLAVVYSGVVPDTFEVGNQVVIEGEYNTNSLFQAESILTKCSSRYVPQGDTGGE